MSLFILPEQALYAGIPNLNKPWAARQPFTFSGRGQEESRHQDGEEERDSVSPGLSIRSGEEGVRAWLGMSFGPQIRAVCMMKHVGKGSLFSLKMKLLGPRQTYYKIQNIHQIPQICRNLATHHAKVSRDYLRLAVDSATRQIHITVSPIVSKNRLASPICSRSVRDEDILSVLKILRVHLQNLKQMMRCVIKIEDNLEFRSHAESSIQRAASKMHKYYQLSVGAGQFQDRTLNEQEISNLKNKNRQQMKILLSKKQSIEGPIAKSLLLFSQAREKKQNQYNLPQEQMEALENMLCVPTEVKRNNNQNLRVLNDIFIKNSGKCVKSKINEGGFADIFQTDLSFWQVDLSQLKDKKSFMQQQYRQENVIKKALVVKEQLLCEGAFVPEGQHKIGRVAHELQIITKMGTAKAIFVPRYYVPLNLPNPFRDCLLMDHISAPTLTQLMELYSQSLSLTTKLWFLFTLTQALRFLRDYKVVHLDLKPSNIFMVHHWVVKLIDFGESYHQEVCGQDFTPGYTVPYSCPELFSNSKTFTDKSDVYSLGVICYELLYARLPFNIEAETKRIDHQMGRYQELWYFAQEEYESFGEIQVLRLLNVLISKCLAVRPQERPELDWMAVTLRHLIETCQS